MVDNKNTVMALLDPERHTSCLQKTQSKPAHLEIYSGTTRYGEGTSGSLASSTPTPSSVWQKLHVQMVQCRLQLSSKDLSADYGLANVELSLFGNKAKEVFAISEARSNAMLKDIAVV